MITTKKYCLFNEDLCVVGFICISVQNVLPSGAHPFCRHAEKMQDKGFQPACLFQWLDLIAEMTDEIEIEVLQHGGNSVAILTSDYDSPNGSPTGEIAKILLVRILCIELVGWNKLVVKV